MAATRRLTTASGSIGSTQSPDARVLGVVVPALPPSVAPVSVDDLVRLHVLEACLEALTAENEILKHRLEFLKRRLAAAETRAAEETVKTKWAIAQFSDLSRRVRSTHVA